MKATYGEESEMNTKKRASRVRAGRVDSVKMRARMARRAQRAASIQDDSSSSDECSPPVVVPLNPGYLQPFENDHPQPREADDSWRKYRTPLQNRRDNLIEIAMRTVMLMRQNMQLQRKLAVLQAETKVFMQSVMNNPENQQRRLAQFPNLMANNQNQPQPVIKAEPEGPGLPTIKVEE